MTRVKDRAAVAALVLANLVPLAGALFFGWRLLDVMLIYWLENGVIGVFNLARMVTAGRAPAATIFFGPFFAVHYGMFWLVHGVFVVALFGPGGFGGADVGTPDPGLLEAAATSPTLPIVGAVPLAPGILWGVLSVVASHGVSFVQNWWLRGERRNVTPAELMMRPYVRVVVLHVTLLAGGVAVTALGRPVFALVLMVVLKIVADVRAHATEHEKASSGPVPAAAGVRPRRAR